MLLPVFSQNTLKLSVSSFTVPGAKGNFRANSDIDLALKGAIDFTTLLKIEKSLDDLLLPYKIDLTNYHKIKNKDLTDHINRVGVLFYEK